MEGEAAVVGLPIDMSGMTVGEAGVSPEALGSSDAIFSRVHDTASASICMRLQDISATV